MLFCNPIKQCALFYNPIKQCALHFILRDTPGVKVAEHKNSANLTSLMFEFTVQNCFLLLMSDVVSLEAS